MTDEERIAEALERIQQAQYLIDDAAQLLCPVAGFAREWSSSHKVHDTIKSYWHRVERRRVDLRAKGRLGTAGPQRAHTGR